MRPWWNEPPPGFTTTGTVSSSVPSGAAARGPASQSSGAWNSVRAGGDFGHVCEPRTNSIGPASACVSWSEIQHVIISGGHEVVRVGRVLVEADRLRPWRLPEDVVLEDPHAPVAGELGGKSARPLGKDLRGDHVVGLPCVAELPRAVLGIASGNPVHLVGPDARLVLAVEQRDVALAEQLEPALGDEAFLDDRGSRPRRRRSSAPS